MVSNELRCYCCIEADGKILLLKGIRKLVGEDWDSVLVASGVWVTIAEGLLSGFGRLSDREVWEIVEED
jgi:hypothetical protein